MKLVCAPADHPAIKAPGSGRAIVLYDQPSSPEQGSAGEAAFNMIRKRKLLVAPRAWDFLSIALAAVTADNGVPRRFSPDGWTRQIELTIAVADPAFWSSQTELLQDTLRFLTTDIWAISFIGDGLLPAPFKDHAKPTETCSALLSGGLDSLIGAIDLTRKGERPYLVSQVSDGDKQQQIMFASTIGGGLTHLQLNHNAALPGEGETSQRSRSIAFFAYGVLVATSLTAYHAGERTTLYASENGLISINPSLTPSRLGSLSTRTTHPIYLKLMQRLLDAAGLNVSITNRYQFKTKGQMLAECADQAYLNANAHTTTSCGRYGRFNYHHCGRCVPCLIRRAAFHRWGVPDTTSYVYESLGKQDSQHAGFDDVRAAAMAVATMKTQGISSVLGANLNSRDLPDQIPYAAVAQSGLEELAAFLQAQGVT